VISGRAPHPLKVQDPELVHVPALQVRNTLPEKLVLQVKEQAEPLAVVPEAQPVPTALAIDGGGLVQTAELDEQAPEAVHTPALQLAEGEPLNPDWHE
jgi:hypothetical protein